MLSDELRRIARRLFEDVAGLHRVTNPIEGVALYRTDEGESIGEADRIDDEAVAVLREELGTPAHAGIDRLRRCSADPHLSVVHTTDY